LQQNRPKAEIDPPRSRASLLVGYGYTWIVSPHGSLQLAGVNLLALCPLDKIARAIRWVSAPPIEHAGVDRLVDVDVGPVVPNIRLLTDTAIKRPRKKAVQSPAERLIGINNRRFQRISIRRDAKKQQKIIQLLCSDSGSHDYTINRRKADEIGLKVLKPSAELYGLLTIVAQSYLSELKTLEPYSPAAMLGGNPTVDYKLIRGIIESTDECYGFVSEGQFTATQGGWNDARNFEGWRKLP
jgi:hypothetical protein